MNSTYINSAFLSPGTTGHLSFSFNGYSNLLNERFERNPLSSSSKCCSCCTCCSCCASICATRGVPMNHSLLYGLRQSTLIQWSASRRLILGGRDRYYYRVPNYGLDNCCYEVSCSFKEKNCRDRIERRTKGRFRPMDLHKRRCSNRFNDAEAVISLLSEEVSEEYLGDRERNRALSKKVELEKMGNYGRECNRRRSNDSRLGFLDGDPKGELKSVAVDLKKEDCRRKEVREEREERKSVNSRGKNSRERKASSSFSSYYSLSSAGDFESDKEAQIEDSDMLEVSSTGYRKELTGEGRLDGQALDEFKRRRDEDTQEDVLEQRTSATRTGVDWDLEKKSEKKLSGIDEMQSKKESSQIHLRMRGTDESEYRKASSSHKQIDVESEESTLAVTLEKGTGNQYSQMRNQIKEHSGFRRNYQEITCVEEIHDRNVETTSQLQKQFIGGEENLIVDANLVWGRRGGHPKKVDESGGNYNLSSNAQRLTEISEIGNDMKSFSNFQRQSDSKVKIQKDDGALCSDQDTSEQHHRTGQMASRRSSDQLSEISEIHDRKSKKTSIVQSETRTKNQERSMSVVSGSREEIKDQRSQIDQIALQRIQSRKGSQDINNISVNITNVSVVNASGTEKVPNPPRTSDKKLIEERSGLTSMKPIQEIREGYNQTDESVANFKSQNETLRPNEASRFREKTSQEASSSQASLNVVSKERVQQIDVEEEDRRMMPPPPQLVARSSMCVDPTVFIATGEVSREESESGFGTLHINTGGRTPASHQEPYGRDGKHEIYREPLDHATSEDVMDSAHRMVESSMQFVGEFVEKARHKVMASEIRKEKTDSDAKLMCEGEEHRQKGSEQYGSVKVKLKEQESRRSSGGSVVKGPSDEMWDVMDPSAQEPPETGAQEDSTGTKNIVSRRRGRSLWSIIADVVRLRWGSHAETPKSAGKSGGMSNDSGNSEAWFSDHDPDDNSDENVDRETRNMPNEVTSSHQQHPGQTSSQDREEMPDTVESEDVVRQLGADASFPSVVSRSKSSLKSTSTPSEEKSLASNQDGKSFQVVPSTMKFGESSLVQLSSSRISSPVVEEIPSTGKTDVSGHSSMELMEQPNNAKLTEVLGTVGKDGELKQRRFQRKNQVQRDRFDEWEEAYVRESELRKIDEMFMREALLEAKKAADEWEVPVGAVLVQHGKIIARGYNLVEELRDSTAHAEMICIREASNQLRTWRLAETTLYVTLEPCAMCAGAILQARIDTLVWGAPNKLLGADGSWIRLFPDGGGNGSELRERPAAPVHPFHPNMKIRRGILASACADVMQQFFQLRRRKRGKKEDLPPEPSCLPIATRQSKFFNKMHEIFHAMFCL